MPWRVIQLLKRLGKSYTQTFGSSLQLTNVAKSYSLWTGQPVYVQKGISSIWIPQVSISARTHEGIVKALDKFLRTNGVSCVFEPKRGVTIMTLTEGYEMREDQISADPEPFILTDHPDYE